jgi:hypothetical protein
MRERESEREREAGPIYRHGGVCSRVCEAAGRGF